MSFDVTFTFKYAGPTLDLNLYGFAWERLNRGRKLSYLRPGAYFSEYLEGVALSAHLPDTLSKRKIWEEKAAKLQKKFLSRLAQKKMALSGQGVSEPGEDIYGSTKGLRKRIRGTESDVVSSVRWEQGQWPGLNIKYSYSAARDPDETIQKIMNYTDKIIRQADEVNTKEDTGGF
jgi:hypothetical protein